MFGIMILNILLIAFNLDIYINYNILSIPLLKDASNFFNFCIRLHAGYGIMKKYWPER